MATIRLACRSDLNVLRDLARAAYAPYVQRMGAEPAPMREDYPALVDTGQLWVAEQDDTVVGLLVLKREVDHLLLENVAVAPDCQGVGVGTKLLDFADSRARRHGLAEVRLYTNEAMTENLVYYPRHGFVETHRAIDDGYRRVFFTKRL